MATGAASNVFVLDIDGLDAEAELTKLETEHGNLPPSVESLTARGRHVWFRYPPDVLVPNSASKIAPGCDIRGNGGYVLAPPSIHPSGRRYEWSVDCAGALAAAPAWLLDKISLPANGATPPLPPEQWRELVVAVLQKARAIARSRSWPVTCCAAGLIRSLRLSFSNHGMQQDACRRFRLRISSALSHRSPAANCRGGPMHDNIIKLAELTQGSESSGEDRLALAFAEQHADNLRYVAAWGRWFAWGGTRWIPDDTLHTFDRVRSLCREVSAKASAQMVAAVERLARADRRLAATVDQWDASPWLLNTPDGVVDLHTGQDTPASSRGLSDQDNRCRTGCVMFNTASGPSSWIASRAATLSSARLLAASLAMR